MAIIRLEIEIKEFEVPKVLESLGLALGKQGPVAIAELAKTIEVVKVPQMQPVSSVVVMPENSYVIPNTPIQQAPIQQAPLQQAPNYQPAQHQEPPVQQQQAPPQLQVVPTYQPPVQQPIAPPPPPVVPTTAPTYSMEQLAVAATQLVDAGRRNELLQLLGTFGVPALTSLPKEQYGEFATQLRGMGAKI
jgi:hypothetical protein